MKLDKRQKEVILELIDIEIGKLQFEINKWGQHKPWQDQMKEYKQIRKIIKQNKNE